MMFVFFLLKNINLYDKLSRDGENNNMKIKSTNLKGNLILLFTAFIWGIAFVAQDKAAEYVSPFTLNLLRCLIAAIALIPVSIIYDKVKRKDIVSSVKQNEVDKQELIKIIKISVFSGFFLCVGMSFQQFGITMYPPEAAASGRSGFITALYVVLVPLFGLFFKNKLNFNIVVSVILSAIGMYFLCFAGGIDKLYQGDLFVFLSAIGFAAQIMIINKYSKNINGIKLSIFQFLVCGFLSMILMFIFEKIDIQSIGKAILPILYLGVISCGVGYTTQIIGQQYSNNPTIDSIIMSFESVFATIGGIIILKESLKINEIAGCLLMFCAIIISQLPSKLFYRKK